MPVVSRDNCVPRGLGIAMGPGVGGGGYAASVGSGVQNVLNSLASFVRNFPGECHRHVIVITFILRNKHQTNIQIEIKELEGGVKATGLFCLLGIGIGLGSLFVYKLYTRFFPKTLLPPSTSAKLKLLNSGGKHLAANNGAAHVSDKALAETPDSGISAETVAAENDAIHFAASSASNPETGSVRRSIGDSTRLHGCRNTVAEWLARSELARSTDLALETDFSSDVFGNQKDLMMKSMRSWRSSGYLSTDPTHGEGDGGEMMRARRKYLNEQGGPACFTLDEDFAYDEVLSITDHMLVPSIVSESPEDDLSDPGADDLGFAESKQPGGKTFGTSSLGQVRRRKLSAGSFLSADVPRLWLRRNRHSFSSDLSSGSSGYTYRESLVSKGFSIDLGEDLTGILTPPDGESGGLDHWTMSSMDQLHKELRKIQDDIDYMNEKVEVLLSKEDGAKLPAALTDAGDCDSGSARRGSTRNRHRSRSLSPARSRSCSVDRSVVDDDLDSPDFIWDYHSDLALDKCNEPMFVVKRPHHILSDGGGQCQRPTRSPELEAAPDGADSRGLLASRVGRNYSGSSDPFSLDGIVESREEGGFLGGNRDLKSSTPVDARVHSESEECQNSFSPDIGGHVPSSPQNLACDHVVSFPGFCFSNACCGHAGPSFISSDATCCTCREQLIFVHPHSPCPGCHGHRKVRAMSARACQKSDRPLSSGHSAACRTVDKQGCSYCRSPSAVHQCMNMNVPVFRCQSLNGSVNQSKQSPNIFSENCTGPCLAKPQLSHISKPHFSGSGNGAKVKVIGNKINLRDFQAEEVSCFDQHHGIKKGYDILHHLWGVTGIRALHSDNYGSLRAVLYQVLLSNLPKLNKSGSFQCSVQKLALAIDSGHSYLEDWRFGNGSALPREEVVMKMTECLRTLFEQVEAVSDMSSVMCREQYLLALLNHSPEMDLSLLEGLKILMMLKAVELFDDYVGQKNVPSFVLQLFAMESSKSLELFFNNHINVIGNTVPMKSVELCLLGLTLDVRIEVMRPYCFNSEGFVVHYPDEGADHFHKVHVIEEDQNSFCIPVMKYLA